MKTVIILTFLMFSVNTLNVHAQLKGLGSRIENKIKRKIDQKADRAIDKVINNTEQKVDEGINGTIKNTDKTGASRDGDFSPTGKFDFIPGEKILFFDDFTVEGIGDFPARWNTSGSGEVVTINGLEGKWLKVPDNTISFPEAKTPLPENFSIEFDLYYPSGVTRPPVTFGFSEVKDPARISIKHKKIFYFRISQSVDENVGYSTSLYSGRETTRGWPANKMAGKIVHVSILTNKQRIRLYMNENKIFDLPRAFETVTLRNNFHFRSAELLPKPREGFYVSNLRIAESGLDIRSQLLNNGKYSTTGIYFETGSANIRPQSYGVLKGMADALGEAPNMKIKIIGHTDNDGGTQFNKELSRKRATAVKTFLEKEFGIKAHRLSVDGKGASEPVAGNATAEDKAANRRVEFIKI